MPCHNITFSYWGLQSACILDPNPTRCWWIQRLGVQRQQFRHWTCKVERFLLQASIDWLIEFRRTVKLRRLWHDGDWEQTELMQSRLPQWQIYVQFHLAWSLLAHSEVAKPQYILIRSFGDICIEFWESFCDNWWWMLQFWNAKKASDLC